MIYFIFNDLLMMIDLGISYQIDKNKGLTRKRKLIEGSARAHNRQKYEKKLKRFKVRSFPLYLFICLFTFHFL